MRVCNVMCILQKYTLPNLWLQTGRPLAEKQSVFHQQRWGWVAVQLFLFAFRWILILDLIESSRVLVQQRDILYYTEKDLKRPEAKWSNMEQTQVMHLCVNGLCSNLSLALTAAQPRDSNGSSPPHLMWQKKSHYSTLSSFQETKPEFQLGDLYIKKVH